MWQCIWSIASALASGAAGYEYAHHQDWAFSAFLAVLWALWAINSGGLAK